MLERVEVFILRWNYRQLRAAHAFSIARKLIWVVWGLRRCLLFGIGHQINSRLEELLKIILGWDLSGLLPWALSIRKDAKLAKTSLLTSDSKRIVHSYVSWAVLAPNVINGVRIFIQVVGSGKRVDWWEIFIWLWYGIILFGLLNSWKHLVTLGVRVEVWGFSIAETLISRGKLFPIMYHGASKLSVSLELLRRGPKFFEVSPLWG